MKIVLDTNVLVAGILNPYGIPANILNLILNEDITLCYDDRIISEYRNVLKREKFGLDHESVDILIEEIEYLGEHCIPKPLGITLIDPDDLMFYEVLESSHAQHLVTGNIRHFSKIKDRRIIRPSEFMRKYYRKH